MFDGVEFRWRRGRLVVEQGGQSGYYPLSMHKSTVESMLSTGSMVGLDDIKLVSEAITLGFTRHPCKLARLQRTASMSTAPPSPLAPSPTLADLSPYS